MIGSGRPKRKTSASPPLDGRKDSVSPPLPADKDRPPNLPDYLDDPVRNCSYRIGEYLGKVRFIYNSTKFYL